LTKSVEADLGTQISGLVADVSVELGELPSKSPLGFGDLLAGFDPFIELDLEVDVSLSEGIARDLGLLGQGQGALSSRRRLFGLVCGGR
jgi:hypothetical protein